MASFESLKVGDVLYKTSREKCGNTTFSRTVVDRIEIASIDTETCQATVVGRRWPLNSASLRLWNRSPPEWVRNPLDGSRCYFCHARKDDGHRDACRHPKAKRAAKAKALVEMAERDEGSA